MYIKTNYIYKPLWRVLVKLFYLILFLSISSYCSGQFYNNNQFILQEKDKQYHFAAGAVVTGITYEWALRKYGNKRKALFISIGMGLAAGIAKALPPCFDAPHFNSTPVSTVSSFITLFMMDAHVSASAVV